MTQVEFFNKMVEKVVEITNWTKGSAEQSVANYLDRKCYFDYHNPTFFGAIDAARDLCKEFEF